MRAAAASLVIVIAGCAAPAAAERTPWPGQDLGEHTVTFVRPTIGPSPTIPVGTAVVIRGNFFNPPIMEVPLGSVVIWTNRDNGRHTVTSGASERSDGEFDREVFGGDTFSFAFLAPGLFRYHCRIHGGMQATLVVR